MARSQVPVYRIENGRPAFKGYVSQEGSDPDEGRQAGSGRTHEATRAAAREAAERVFKRAPVSKFINGIPAGK